MPSSVLAGAIAFFQRAVCFFQDGLIRAFEDMGLSPVQWQGREATGTPVIREEFFRGKAARGPEILGQHHRAGN